MFMYIILFYYTESMIQKYVHILIQIYIVNIDTPLCNNHNTNTARSISYEKRATFPSSEVHVGNFYHTNTTYNTSTQHHVLLAL